MTRMHGPAVRLGRTDAGERDRAAGYLDAHAEDGVGPSDAHQLRELMRHWPTGVSVITTQEADRPAGCTASAVMCVSLTPPLLVVALAAESSTLKAISRTGAFSVNVLGSDQGELGQRFARGEHRDRFHGLNCRYQCQLPLLPGVVAWIVCRVWSTTPCGDHVLVIGGPVWHMARHDRSPLIRFRSGYRRLADVPGSNGLVQP